MNISRSFSKEEISFYNLASNHAREKYPAYTLEPTLPADPRVAGYRLDFKDGRNLRQVPVSIGEFEQAVKDNRLPESVKRQIDEELQ